MRLLFALYELVCAFIQRLSIILLYLIYYSKRFLTETRNYYDDTNTNDATIYGYQT